MKDMLIVVKHTQVRYTKKARVSESGIWETKKDISILEMGGEITMWYGKEMVKIGIFLEGFQM